MTISKAYACTKGNIEGAPRNVAEERAVRKSPLVVSNEPARPAFAQRIRRSFPTLTLLLLAIAFLAGCHKGGNTITVTILPSTSPSVDEGQPYNFQVTVANDTSNKGVIWSLGTTNCSGSACGALSNVQPFSVTYTAPTGLSATESITLTATSVTGADTATATISIVLPPEFTTGGTSATTQLICSGPCQLASGQNGVPYNQTITATDGIAPLTFSLQSGSSLPPGLKVNPSGSIVGTPSSPTLGQNAATYTFTVLLTDTGTPPLSVPQQFFITVQPPPVLSITTSGSLSAGFINGSYSTKVSATGGTTPLTWSLVPGSGSLPNGLSLNTTSGQITGIPIGPLCTTPTPPATTCAPVTSSFKVQAVDSSIPAQTATSNTLSITVQQPAALTISTPSLLANGSTGASYSAALLATGGIAPYTWTLTSGQLPNGLSLSPTGSITGTPLIAMNPPVATTFTLQVTDSEVTPMTASQSFSLTIDPGTTGDDSILNGQYTFLFKGFDVNGPVAAVGSFVADGNGNITAGSEDTNRVSSGTVQVVKAAPLSGTYSIGTDGRGTMEINAVNLSTNVLLITDYNLVVDSAGVVHLIDNNSLNTTATSGLDTLGTHGEGILKPVNAGTSTSSGTTTSLGAANFNGNYAFEFTGQDLSGKQVALAGSINANGTNLTVGGGGVNSDLNDNGTLTTQSVSGSFTATGSNNRGTASMLMEVGSSQLFLTFDFYFVSPTDLYFIEVDSPLTTTLIQYFRLSGEMIGQQSGYQFQTSSLNGSSVATGTGLSGSNSSVFAGLVTSTNGGMATFSYDENNNGAIAGPSFNGTYSIAGNGRVSFSGLGAAGSSTRLAVAYLTGPGSGFLLGSDAAVTTGRLEQQTLSSVTLANIQDGYTLSGAFPGDTSVPAIIGQLNAAGTGPVSLTGTVDEVDVPVSATPEGLAHPNQSFVGTINSLAANGRGTLATNSPVGMAALMDFYVVSPGSFRGIPADASGDTHPQIFFFTH